MVCESDRTNEIGSELELPKTYDELSNNGVDVKLDELTPMAMTKLRGLFEKPNAFATAMEQMYEMMV